MANILIVDDDDNIGRLIRLALSAADLDSERVAFAADGLDALQAAKPDLIVLDLRLPDMDGQSFLKRARELGYTGPVLVLTAMDRRDAVVEELEREIGKGSLLFKPFDPEDLVQRVRELLAGTA